MYQPIISIITVVYNRVNSIEQLLSSVINQTYGNIEFIVVDGGSDDGTVDIIKKYEKKISRWISESDYGIYNAMNKGIAMATGDYIEIIGSDDALNGKDAIKSIIPYLRDEPDILSANEYIIYPDVRRQRVYSNSNARNKETYRGGMVGHAAMFTKRSIFKKYKFDETYRIAADYKFFLQCYYDNDIEIKYIDECVAFYESEADGASANYNETLKENSRIYKELCLPFDDKMRGGKKGVFLKNIIICIAEFLHIRLSMEKIYRRYLLSKKHRCENIICRWCGRGA